MASNKQRTLRAFELKTGGEVYIIAARTAMQALKHYTAMDDERMVNLSDDDEIIEIPKIEWGNRLVRNGEYDHDNPGEEKEFYTLQELMEGHEMPEIISTTIQD